MTNRQTEAINALARHGQLTISRTESAIIVRTYESIAAKGFALKVSESRTNVTFARTALTVAYAERFAR